jgi:hypothetical protein
MPASTAEASAICGTHFGLTKLAASMWLKPQAESRSISAIFYAVGMMRASFCSPSRGPNS